MQILTRKQTADRLGLSERTIDRLCKTDGALTKVQLSTRRVGFTAESVSAYLERQVVAAAA
jgi:predicted DNA-binding transcriptional regulator AlpA